jgi:glycine/D-amino acid oxidase-like deaminating enzyme
MGSQRTCYLAEEHGVRNIVVLEKGWLGGGNTGRNTTFVPLDLGLAAFPAGTCTRTFVGKADIVIWLTAADVFRIEVWHSFAPYVWACLEEARREHLDK